MASNESADPRVRQKYVGQPRLRVEDSRLLRGGGNYIDDISRPGMLHAAFLRSPYAHARFEKIDVSRALELPGVRAVVTGEDIKDVTGPLVAGLNRPECKSVGQLILPLDTVRYVGEAVAVVVADSRYLAEDGVELIDVDWEPLAAIVDPEAAIAPGAPVIHAEIPDNNFGHIEFSNGDVDGAFARADRVFSKKFYVGRCMAAPLEGRGVIADYDAGTGEVTLWTSSQSPHFARTVLAGPTGFPEGKLRIIAPDLGGGFGVKSHVFVEEAVMPAVSRIVGRPVKWIEDRYEHLAASSHAKEMVVTIEIAVTNEGKFLAFRGHYVANAGAYAAFPLTSFIDPLTCAPLLPSLYDIEAVEWKLDSAITNKCPSGAYRGVGWTCGHLGREALIDEIARELEIDPVELRVQNCIPSEPFTSITGLNYDGGSYVESIRKAQELVGYEEVRAEQARLRDEGRYLGIGFSPFVEPTAWGSHIAHSHGFPVEYFDTSSLTIEPDGSVIITNGFHNHGQGHQTSLAQLAADHLGVRPEDVKILYGDTDAHAYGMGTFASRSAVIGGGTIIRAARDVREKLGRLAAHAMEVSPDDLEFADGRVGVVGVPEKSMSIGEVSALAYWGGAARPADLEPSLTSTRHYDPAETYSNGTMVAVVEVDIGTGLVQIRKIVAVEDCGTMLNPMIVEGQIAGAVAQGVGASLLEEIVYDENGQLLTGTLMDYLYPSATEVPPMELSHIETPSTVTEGGIKGVGEGGMISAPAAVVNAVADALSPFGVAIGRTPIGPSYIADLLRSVQT